MSTERQEEPFSHVLCWVDGSAQACRAAETGAMLARRLNAKISFLAIGDEVRGDRGFEEYARIEGVSAPNPIRMDSKVSACLDQATSIAARVGITRPERLMRTGNAAAAICDAARAQGADLVVMGCHRSNLVERVLHVTVGDRIEDGCGFAVLSVN